MLLWENIILAINGLLSNKSRALLTMLGIIIGIGSVIAIMTVGDSLSLSVSSSMQSMGANDIYVMLQSKEEESKEGSIDGVVYGSFEKSETATEDDYISTELISELCEEFKDEIYAINIEHSIGSTEVSEGTKSASISLSSVSAGYFVTNDLTILEGNVFSEEDFSEGKNAILVSDQFVEDLYDIDNKNALGKEIQITSENNVGTFTIVGVYEYEQAGGGMPFGGGNTSTSVYMPLKAGLNFDHSDDSYSSFQVIADVGVDSDTLANKIENFFEPYYRNNRNFEVSASTLGSMVSMLTEMLSTITLAIAVVAAIALVVGGIGVMNIMLVSITERTREIGTRKALGAKNSSIRIQFIVEAMIICLIGGAIGVILGIGFGILASNLLGYPATPSITAILTSLLFSMSIGIFFGYYPANKAAKMNPIDALRYE